MITARAFPFSTRVAACAFVEARKAKLRSANIKKGRGQGFLFIA
jgi:hypothetical protein